MFPAINKTEGRTARMKKIQQLLKDNGTQVFVRFGLAHQLVLLEIKDWDQELKDLRTEQIKSRSIDPEIYEISIAHSLQCKCCTRVIRESYTRPTYNEASRKKPPGRPRGRSFRHCRERGSEI